MLLRAVKQNNIDVIVYGPSPLSQNSPAIALVNPCRGKVMMVINSPISVY
jgi:hypothetical protein